MTFLSQCFHGTNCQREGRFEKVSQLLLYKLPSKRTKKKQTILKDAIFIASSTFAGIGIIANFSNISHASFLLNNNNFGIEKELKTKLNRELIYKVTPKRKALLNTIRYAEGTWSQGYELGYRVLYGGGYFSDLSRHPEKVIIKKYRSAAAGAYQIIPTTWKSVSAQLKLKNFKPSSQDQAALHLVKKRGVLEEFDRNGISRLVISSLSNEWASFPDSKGVSKYGQPVIEYRKLVEFYKENLRQISRTNL